VLERKAAESTITLEVKPSPHALLFCLQHIRMYIGGLLVVFQCKDVLMYNVIGMGFFPAGFTGNVKPNI
jgi:hypothetical protein